MTSGTLFSFALFLLYLALGVYLAVRSGRKEGQLAQAHVSFGLIYVIVGFAYLLVGLEQLFHQQGYPLADQACAIMAQCVAFSVTIPAAFFSSFLLTGNPRLSRYLMIAYVAITCVAIGLTGTSSMHVVEYGWGSAWDFSSALLKTYSLLSGTLPALVAVAGFIVLIFRPLTSHALRRRVVIIAVSFICLVGAWTIMPSGQEAVVVASRVLALLGALSAYLAYYPPIAGSPE